MTARTVAVTGATGFLGSRVASHLARAGWRVIGIVRPGGANAPPEGVERIEASLEPSALAHACRGAEAIVHLAGVTAESAQRRFSTNIDSTRVAIHAAVTAGATLVQVSSQAVAGPGSPDDPRREDDPPRPLTPYARSKAESERLVREAAGLRWTILRPGAVYGPGDRSFLLLFRLARRGLLPLVQPATTAYTLVHVDDVARAVETSLQSERALGETFFVGHPAIVTIADMRQALAQVWNRPVRPVRVPYALLWIAAVWGDLVQLSGRPAPLTRDRLAELAGGSFVCSTEKAARLLGWQAEVPLVRGFTDTARWYEDAGWMERGC